MSQSPATGYTLPSALITRADLARLVREVEALDNELESQKARSHATGHTGQTAYHLPVISQGLHDFAELNKLDLANDQARMQLKDELKIAKDKAPVIHMTFAVEADPESLAKLAEYIRRELHPQALLQVGLQPALVGGVYMRTPNHIHDFSMRARLAQSRSVIAQDIEQLVGSMPVAGMPEGVSMATASVPVAAAPIEVDETTAEAAPAQPVAKEQA